MLNNSFVYDLAAEITYFDLGLAARDLIWDNRVHLAEEGYRRMGFAIADYLSSVVKETSSLEAHGETK